MLGQGKAQALINALLQADMEHPVQLPIKPIETEVILPPETKMDLFEIAGALTVGAGIVVLVYNLTK